MLKDEDFSRMLLSVERPARYVGGEWGAYRKNPAGLVNVCWCFPDTYEIGMSNLAGRIIYDRLNRNPDAACDRCFLPWTDMQEALVRRGLPLFSLEQRRPLHAFDVVAVTLGYELSYTNFLKMLELGGIPLTAAERGDGPPLVIVGGPCTTNPEPLADFVDAGFVGETEDFLPELVRAVAGARGDAGFDKRAALEELGRCAGVYLPNRIRIGTEDATGQLVPDPGSAAVDRRLAGLDPHIESPLVPGTDIVHDRVTLEVMRGCTGGCRFCQAGMIYRPVRSLEADEVFDELVRQLRLTGYDEANVSSLSSTDWRGLARLVERVLTEFGHRGPSISFPSLRVGEAVIRLEWLLSGRRLGSLTIAPEAGSERLREVINKPHFTNDEVVQLARRIFETGFTTLKLYFMFGLPTETGEDLAALIALSRRCAEVSGKKQMVNVALSPFIPKPHTPFQWAAQTSLAELEEKLARLQGDLRHRKINIKWNSPRMALVEAALTRGDRRVSRAILEAHRRGAVFDAWDEFFDLGRWRESFAAAGLSLEEYANRELPLDARLPWDCVNNLVHKTYLLEERARAMEGKISLDCRRSGCNVCGVEPELCEPGTLGALEGELERLMLYPPEPNLPEPPLKVRVRFEFEKIWPASLLGHLELKNLLARSIRRAGYTLRMSSGFNPQPRLVVALPLPLGVESRAEVAEVELATWFSEKVFVESLNRSLPPGVSVKRAVELRPGAPKLSECVRVAEYLAGFKRPPEGFSEKIAQVLTQKKLLVTRVKDGESKEFEVRASLLDLQIRGGLLKFSLWFEPSVPSLRVDELWSVLGIPPDRQPETVRTGMRGVDHRGAFHDLFSDPMVLPWWEGGGVRPKSKG
ncbi:MAG TPA: TIGR03960 family B12-binding radical SAM protein [bacterium]|nr:TIGR03960 family B12-binding radical SAM protein [bacterium]